MLNTKTIIISSLNKFFSKFFTFFLSIFFVINSLEDYATIILFFVMSAYAYEIFSLSLSKTFNIIFFNYEKKSFELFVSFSIYVCFLIFFISLLIVFSFNNFFSNNKIFVEYYFLISFLFVGFSIAIEDIIDRYCWLKFKHNQIYLFGIFKIIIIIIFSAIFFVYFSKFKINIFIIFYTSLILFLTILKCLIFLNKLNFNILDCIENIKTFNFNTTFYNTSIIFVISMLLLIQFSSNRIIISYFEGNIIFANFYFHVQIVELCTFFFLIIQEVFGPSLAHVAKLNNLKKIKIFQDKVFKVLLLFPPIIFLYIICSSSFIINIINPEINRSFWLLVILIFSSYSTFFFLSFYQYLIMSKKRKLIACTILFSVLINLFLSVWLINFFSITGVAFANFISNFLLFIICNQSIKFFFFRKKTFVFAYYCILRFIYLIILQYMVFKFFLLNSDFINLIVITMIFLFSMVIFDFFVPYNHRVIKLYFEVIKFINKVK